MGEVRYSINGKYFKDYGIYVSSSLGLLDALKRKPIKTYDWPEYHGESLDLSNPKFEAREIVLNCFVKGDNYQEMFDNFRNVVLSEFQKSGTQRLLVEPFGYKALPYEVYMIDEVKIAKEFSESISIGVFSIKLIEPNPIKKVLYLTENTLNLSYNSSKETEIFFVNGEKTTAKGNVSLSGKTLANRVVSGYDFHGRNLALNSKGFLDQNYDWVRNINLSENLIVGQQYTVRIKFKAVQSANDYFGINDINGGNSFPVIKLSPLEFGVTFTADANSSQLVLIRLPQGSGNWYQFESFKIEKGTKATDWTPAPEDEKYIIIAGNVDEITGLTTNAEVLWEKL